MKLSHKVKKAFRRDTYTHSRVFRAPGLALSRLRVWRASRRLERIELRRQNLTVDHLLRSFDEAALERLRERYEGTTDRADVFWTKYLDYRKWLALNIRYANELGLVADPPRRVLDLGCGGGYFLAVCRHLGSQVAGLDLDRDLVLNEMIAVLKIKRVVFRVRPLVALPKFKRRFDLITAWMVCFNLPMNRAPWTGAEWDFFLTDLSSRLAPKGRVILSLNRQLDDGELYNDEVRACFVGRGALIAGKRLTFKQEDLLRTVGQWRGMAEQPVTAA